MKTTFFFFGISALCIIGTVITLAQITGTTPKTDYYLNIDQSDYFYLLDRKGDTIYVEKLNEAHPTDLQKAIFNDNL